MSIYHLSIKTISRSTGRSAVAAAAYRSGETLLDDRTGILHDYTRKGGVEHSEILLPAGTSPQYSDRSALWNHAEQTDKRKNSVTAREYEIALPSELDSDQRQEVCRDFGKWLGDRFGVAVDIAIHEPHREGDARNFHAHILTTTREMGPDGLGKKTRELDDKKTGAVSEVREKWAEVANRHLERAGVSQQIDHRSHKARGLAAAPTLHMGQSATAMERRGIKTPRGKRLDVIKAANLAVQLAMASHEIVKREAEKAVENARNILSAAAERLRNREKGRGRARSLDRSAGRERERAIKLQTEGHERER